MTIDGLAVRVGFAAGAAVVALIAFASAPVRAERWQEQEFVCPIDGSKFKYQVQISGSGYGRRVDGMWFGRSPPPWPVPQCHNGFPIYKETFSESELTKARALVASEEFQSLRTTETPRFVVAHTAEKLGESSAVVVQLYLQASWTVESDRERNRRYVGAALDHLDSALADRPLDDKARAFFHVLKVELLRRVDRFDEAQSAIEAIPEGVAANPQVADTLAKQRERIAARDWRPL